MESESFVPFVPGLRAVIVVHRVILLVKDKGLGLFLGWGCEGNFYFRGSYLAFRASGISRVVVAFDGAV